MAIVFSPYRLELPNKALVYEPHLLKKEIPIEGQREHEGEGQPLRGENGYLFSGELGELPLNGLLPKSLERT